MSGSYIIPLKRVFLNLSGGTVTGDTVFTQGVYANILTGGTYYSGSTLLSFIIENIAAGVVSSSAATLATYVQPGANIITGGTPLSPIISTTSSPSFNNLFSSGSSDFNIFTAFSISGGTISGGTIFSGGTNLQNTFNLFNTQIETKANRSGDTFIGQINAPSISATTLSGGTINSGSTNLYDIFQKIGTDVQTAVQPGSNISTGGTLSVPFVNIVSSPSFDNLFSSGNSQLNTITAVSISGGTISGGTIFSGNTNLQNTFNSLNSQLGTKANLSGATFTGPISATAITNSQLISGEVVYASVGGLLKTNSGFTYDDSVGNLYSNNIQVGSPSFSGTVTIWGNVNVMGQAVSAFTSDLFIKDNNISLNYNPTASTISTSLGAGFTIQDGSGVPGIDVYWDIRGSAATIYNRSFATNLYDIIIRESGTTSSPSGVRLLAEYDILNGGLF